MKSIVVAYDQKRGIGAKNDLLWKRSLPADLRRFKALTMGHTIIMGSNTYDSIGRALPGRETIVLTPNGRDDLPGAVKQAASLEEAYELASHDIYISGGGSVYAQTIDDVDVIYATEVQETFENADVFFPELGEEWRETSRLQYTKDDKNAYDYDFVTYERV